MAEIVNLTREKKRRARAAATSVAAANRALHGRTGADKVIATRAASRDRARHDGHLLDRDTQGESTIDDAAP